MWVQIEYDDRQVCVSGKLHGRSNVSRIKTKNELVDKNASEKSMHEKAAASGAKKTC